MKKQTLGFAISLLLGVQASYAITPWTTGSITLASGTTVTGFGTPDYYLYTSGASVQDKAHGNAIVNTLADSTQPIDYFADVDASNNFKQGARWTAYYFISNGNTVTINGTIYNIPAGKKVYLEKRSVGSSGYGVVPLLANMPIEHLNVFQTAKTNWAGYTVPSSTTNTTVLTSSAITNPIGGALTTTGVGINDVALTGATISAGAVNNSKTIFTATGAYNSSGNMLLSGVWLAPISSTTASTYLKKVISDAGFSGNDPNLLLRPKTVNYPAQITELTTGTVERNWPTGLTSVPTTGSGGFTVIPTGGVSYAVAVTWDLYKVLQFAQITTGRLSSSCTVGLVTEACMPSLNRTVLGSLLAGKIGTWNQFKYSNAGATALLTDSATLTGAGVTALSGSNLVNGEVPVAVATRNQGAAVVVVAASKFLGYPDTTSAVAPAALTPTSTEATAAPILKAPASLSASATLLSDWQSGTDSLGLNSTGPTSGACTTPQSTSSSVNSAGVITTTTTAGSSCAKRWGLAFMSVDQTGGLTTNPTTPGKWAYIKIDGASPTVENIASGDYPYWTEGTTIFRTSKPNDSQWSGKTAMISALAASMGSPTTLQNFLTQTTWGMAGAFSTSFADSGISATIPYPTTTSALSSSTPPVVPFSHNLNGVLNDQIVPVVNDGTNNVTSPIIQLK